MATKSFEFTCDGNSKCLHDNSPTIGFNVDGASLYRVRAKKSASGGYFAFNIDATGVKEGKYPPWQDQLYDFNPKSLEPDLADGDDITDIPDDTGGGKEATATTGAEASFATAGSNIATDPAIEFSISSKLIISGTYPSFGNGEPFTAALVVDSGGNNHRAAIGTDVGSSTYCTWWGNDASRRVYVQDEAGNSLTSTSQEYFQDSDIRVLRRDSSNNVVERRRGSQTLSGTLSGTIGFESIGWVRQVNTVSAWNGLGLTRIIIIQDALSNDEMEEMEAWLAWHYGLQTSTNSYLPSGHVGYQSDTMISDVTPSFSSDIDISSLGADTWSSYVGPNTSTISGDIEIYPTKAYKAGTVTIEVLVSY